MLKRLAAPLTRREMMLLAAGAAVAVALYCYAYNALAGRHESLGEALVWPAVNVLPWIGAVEAGKRFTQPPERAAVLAAALMVSLGLHALFYGMPEPIAFELARRLPGAAAAAAFLLLIGSPAARGASPAALPLLPNQIDWVSAAGNYVELHAGGRTIVHRASLSAVEAALGPGRFVRVHRSTLVRRDAIARVRSVDLVLRDGTSLVIGKRYRAAVAALAGDFRPFVPQE